MTDLMMIEKMLSGNAVLVINSPYQGKHGWIFPCYIHKEAYKNGAIENAKTTLNAIGIDAIFGAPDKKGEGHLDVYVFERN